MNTSEFIAECRDELDDPVGTDGDGKKYSNAQLVRAGDRAIRGLHRTMADGNKEWSQFDICLQKESALELFRDEWEYRLPTWVTHVTEVWRRDQAATSESSFSAYRWSPQGATVRGQVLPKFTERRRPHWEWTGQHTLRLSRYTEALELVVTVTTRPPPMFKAKIATVHAEQNKLYLPPSPSYGEIAIEEGSYINSLFQVTTTVDTNATQFSDVRRCVYSNAATIVTGTRQHELTFDANWTATLAADDIVETILLIPDEHTRLLVLKVAQAMFQKRGNKNGLAIIAPEMGEELKKFMDFASTPRDKRGPSFIRRSAGDRRPYYTANPDRIWNW